MFQKRLNSALGMKSSIKVRKQKIIDAFKRELAIASGSNGKKDYNVVLTSNSSCSCPHCKRNGSKLYSKHLICLVLYVLGNERFLTSLKERYFPEDDLKVLFRNKDIPELYRQPQEVLKRPRNFLRDLTVSSRL